MVTNNVLSVLHRGPSMAILFANEYALTMVSLLGSGVRFSLNCIDALALESEEPFEQRSTILFYLDFAVDLLKLIIYTGFFAVVMSFYGLPIHIIRDLYVTVISFSKRVRDMIKYHQIMSSLQSRYPDVSSEEIAACNDPTCIICREEMVTAVKRLPCGHFFHFKCLKSWLERQQVCPTCRKSVLDAAKPAAAAAAAAPPAATDERPNWSETNSNCSATLSQSHYSSSHSQSQLSVNTSPANILHRSNSTELFMSPLRRSHSTSSLLPVLLMDEDEKEILISEQEKLKIATELERLGRRSREPEPVPEPETEPQSAQVSTPISPLSHVKAKIEYVEELMEEHEKLLEKLRKIESDLVRERSMQLNSDNE